MSDRNTFRDRDRDRDRERKRDRDDRDRKDRERSKRSHTPDRTRFRSTRSPDRDRDRENHRSRSHHHINRSLSPEPPRKRHKDRDSTERDRQRATVSEFVDGIAREQQKTDENQKSKKKEIDGAGGSQDDEVNVDETEIDMMRQLGIPLGFDSTKGKPVSGNDVGGVRVVTKRQPRQYMNRRGGFNRPLPAELNR